MKKNKTDGAKITFDKKKKVSEVEYCGEIYSKTRGISGESLELNLHNPKTTVGRNFDPTLLFTCSLCDPDWKIASFGHDTPIRNITLSVRSDPSIKERKLIMHTKGTHYTEIYDEEKLNVKIECDVNCFQNLQKALDRGERFTLRIPLEDLPVFYENSSSVNLKLAPYYEVNIKSKFFKAFNELYEHTKGDCCTDFELVETTHTTPVSEFAIFESTHATLKKTIFNEGEKDAWNQHKITDPEDWQKFRSSPLYRSFARIIQELEASRDPRDNDIFESIEENIEHLWEAFEPIYLFFTKHGTETWLYYGEGESDFLLHHPKKILCFKWVNSYHLGELTKWYLKSDLISKTLNNLIVYYSINIINHDIIDSHNPFLEALCMRKIQERNIKSEKGRYRRFIFSFQSKKISLLYFLSNLNFFVGSFVAIMIYFLMEMHYRKIPMLIFWSIFAIGLWKSLRDALKRRKIIPLFKAQNIYTPQELLNLTDASQARGLRYPHLRALIEKAMRANVTKFDFS